MGLRKIAAGRYRDPSRMAAERRIAACPTQQLAAAKRLSAVMPEGLCSPTMPVTTFNDGRATMTGRWRRLVLQPGAGLADLPPPPH